MSALTIWHNPKCSKSRETLALLRARGLEPRIVEYLKAPPSAGELKSVAALLGIRPEALVRRSEPVYRAKYAGRSLADEEWLAALAENPVLIERPIVIAGGKAVIGRPPARALEILEA